MAIGRELRHGLRSLRREPGFAITAILTLAAGIGANAAMVGLADRMLLSPPPGIADPRQVVRLELGFTAESGERFAMETTSYPVFQDLAGGARSFVGLAAVSAGTMVLGRGEQARPVRAAKVSGDYFSLLRAAPALGRLFGRAEDAPPNGIPVAVLSHAFWRRSLGGDPGLVGREILLDDAAYQVVGVARPDFTGESTEPVDLWVPLSAAQATAPAGWREARGYNVVGLLGRLRPGVTRDAAEGDATRVLRQGQAESGRRDETARIELQSLVAGLGDRTTAGRIALWLAGVSFIVFLIAVANVTNLLLVQAVRRRRELAVRAALGASRMALVRQLAIESLILAGLGGVVALGAAGLGGEAVRALLIPNLAATESLLPPNLVRLTAASALAGGLLVGILPALRASRPSVIDDLKTGSAGAGLGRAPLLSGFLVAQAALSVILLVGAGLFVSSLHRVRTQDLGFEPRSVYLATMAFGPGLPGSTQDALYRQAEEVVRRLPGVVRVSIAQAVPFGHHHVPPISVPGREAFPDPRQQAPFLNAATADYFPALGLRILEGRGFTDLDREGSPLVVVVNQAMARGLWPGESPLGRCIRAGFAPGEVPHGITASPTLPCRTVVGVVNDARPRSIREEPGQARMQYYVPFGQVPPPPDFVQPRPPEIATLLVKTAGGDRVPESIRRAMQSFAPGLPLTEVVALQDVLDRQMRPWTLGAAVFSGLGLLALVLAAIGLYGVRAYVVTQRTREIGVRMALGAARREVMAGVLADGLRVMGLGLGLGLAAALAGGPWIEPLLFGTSARDPLTFLATGIVLAVVSAAASAIPAWRAASIDPSRALRTE